jgi:hypothetical protein
MPTTKTQAQLGYPRLRTLYALMAGIPAKHVNLSLWRGHTDKSRDANFVDDEEILKHPCQTSGCAVGYACAHPDFKEEGLEYLHNHPVLRNEEGVITHTRFHAVTAFFGVPSFDTAESLFLSEEEMCARTRHPEINKDDHRLEGNDKRQVLARIRNFLRAEGCITSKRVRELEDYERNLT